MDAMIVHAEARGRGPGTAAGCWVRPGWWRSRSRASVGVTAQVVAEPPGALERSVGKVKRVVDRRPKDL